MTFVLRMVRPVAPVRTGHPEAEVVAEADAARDGGRIHDAARLYDEALLLAPERRELLTMSGHMHKEAGDPARAEQRYLAAWAIDADDADLAMQLGHLAKRRAQYREAESWYARAGELAPDWDEPPRERAHVAWLRHGDLPAVPQEAFDSHAVRLIPGAVEVHRPDPGLTLFRLGRDEQGRWGIRRTLRGVEAIRGRLIAVERFVTVDLLIDGARLRREPLQCHPTVLSDGSAATKHVFNLWIDLTDYAVGPHPIELCFLRADGSFERFDEEVIVAPPPPLSAYPDSAARVDGGDVGAERLEAEIRARPSMIQPATRTLFPDGVGSALVMRTDQLGDVVASVPALRRLRSLLPDARLVGLVTAANADIMRSLGLLDELIVINFPDDPVERRRIMPLEDQQALRDRLAPYRFDIAIDLAASSVSRELLKLSGARYVHGSGGGDWTWLTGDAELRTHDRWTGFDVVPHSAKVIALVEALGAVLDTRMPVIRRPDIQRSQLRPYGIGEDDSFILFHAGARIAFSRWPHFGALAAMLLDRTRRRVVLMGDDPAILAAIPADVRASPRFLLLPERLPFDDFDAFISFADVVVGNDSGPKHLAALRGTPVVTLFSARIDWREWGQENVGTIISRRVPCAGCAIFHDADECGQDFACIRDIGVNEVFEAVAAELGGDVELGDTPSLG